MRKILVIGAGKSTAVLIKYFKDKSISENLYITIGDISIENAKKLAGDHSNTEAVLLDVFDQNSREKAIQNADIVVSMLPARFHIEVAKDCLLFGKCMVTASYVSPEMQELDAEVRKKGLVFMNEIGVDPGVDHMSAMQVIDRIRNQGGKIILFESFTGGLVAPKVILTYGIINLPGILEMLLLPDKVVVQNSYKKEHISIYLIINYLEEQNFLKSKVMAVLKPMQIEIL